MWRWGVMFSGLVEATLAEGGACAVFGGWFWPNWLVVYTYLGGWVGSRET